MAFVRWSGVRPLMPALRQHRDAGRRVRLITTTYTNSTEARALDALAAIGAQVRVSYDTSTTRLHAKAWLFHRGRGATTAYIGSSNLTHSAQVTGLEWNVRVSGLAQSCVVSKVAAVFESYWESDDFVPYDRVEFLERTLVVDDGRQHFELPPTEIHLRPFQQRLLEQIEVARRHGRHRNLLVAATGTGKTVMAAIDYVRLRSSLPRARLLFVAHRQEILEQSRATFRHALRDASFGELWVGQHRPQRFEHVFASIQSLNAVGLAALDPAHFDVVIVDEFHHAAAPSYRALLEHVAAGGAPRSHGDPGTRRRPRHPALLRRSDRRGAAGLGCDRPAIPGPVHLLRHPRRPGPDRSAVATRPGLRRRRPHQRLYSQRHLGEPARQPAARTCGRRDDHAGARVLRLRRARPLHGPPVPATRDHRPSGVGRLEPAGPARCAARPGRWQRCRPVHRRPLQRGHRCPQRRHAPPAASDGECHALPAAAGPRPPPGRRQVGMHGPRLRRAAPPRVPLRPPIPGAARRQPTRPAAAA